MQSLVRVTSSALKLMLHRIFDKLDYKQQGYLDATPDPAQESLSSFESAFSQVLVSTELVRCSGLQTVKDGAGSWHAKMES